MNKYTGPATMFTLLLLQVVCLGTCHAFILSSSACKIPAPSTNFTNEKYYGLWYEVGKIQTAGGAFFEKECVCTTIGIQSKPGATNGDASAINSCRRLSPSGSFLNATGSLTGEVVPGHWKEGFFFLAPKADYTIVYLDENYAIEYDCTSTVFSTDYCVHLLSRKPTADSGAVSMLLTFANSLGLNTDNLDYQQTLQTGCW